MNVENLMKNKKGIQNSRLKTILSFLIIIVMTTPTLSAQAVITQDDDQHEIYWKHYPYQPPGTDIVFPTDEGAHDTTQIPIEWWYANFHLTGQTTGQEYGSFVAFYKIQTSVAEQKEVRIFSISDLASETTYNNVQIGTLTASTDHLDLSFEYITDYDIEESQTSVEHVTEIFGTEHQQQTNALNLVTTMESMNESVKTNTTCVDMIQGMDLIENYQLDIQEHSNELIQSDFWYTKSNDQGLLPFQYTLEVSGNSQQDSRPMELDVNLDCLKKPLLVGGDGVIELGKNQHLSYYYCLSKLVVIGSITLHGITEIVTGYAWIDHQWGDFLNQNSPPYGLVVSYEWFSIKLNDKREILAGDTWDQETGEKIDKSFSNGLNLLHRNGTLELLKEYTIIAESFWNDEYTHRIYASKWHIIETSKSIDITITPSYENQMMYVGGNYPTIRQILNKLIPGSCFWEGVCTVTGTINGIFVQGNAYVELTHHYDNEQFNKQITG